MKCKKLCSGVNLPAESGNESSGMEHNFSAVICKIRSDFSGLKRVEISQVSRVIGHMNLEILDLRLENTYSPSKSTEKFLEVKTSALICENLGFSLLTIGDVDHSDLLSESPKWYQRSLSPKMYSGWLSKVLMAVKTGPLCSNGKNLPLFSRERWPWNWGNFIDFSNPYDSIIF